MVLAMINFAVYCLERKTLIIVGEVVTEHVNKLVEQEAFIPLRLRVPS